MLSADSKLKYGKKGAFLGGTISALMRIIDWLVGAFQTFRVDFFSPSVCRRKTIFSVCIGAMNSNDCFPSVAERGPVN